VNRAVGKPHVFITAESLEAISEIGSGLNFKRQKFLDLMEQVARRKIGLIGVAYPDRLVRFGFDFVEWFCTLKECRIVVLTLPGLKDTGIVRVEGSITTPPLPSETVLATFTAHGYSMCFLLSLQDFLTACALIVGMSLIHSHSYLLHC